MAESQGENLPSFLATKHCSGALAFIILDETRELTHVLNFIDSQIACSGRDLLARAYPDIIQHLVWYLGDNSTPRAQRR